MITDLADEYQDRSDTYTNVQTINAQTETGDTLLLRACAQERKINS